MLKSLLSLLLSKFYSKQENDTISHLATPTINNPVNVTLTTDANSVIVAPFDGYLNIETTAEGNPTINVWEALWCNSTPISPAQAKIFVPVTKGQRIQYRITGTISQARFVRLVGGGYQTLKKLLLQGGGLCLNSLSSSLRRSSLLAISLGYTKTLSLLRTTLSRCSQVRQEFQNEATQRRLMEWPLSLLEKHRPKIFPVSWMSTVSGDNSSKTLNKVGKLIRLFTSLKATFFTWQQGAVIQRSVSSCSIPRPNLTVGGASC